MRNAPYLPERRTDEGSVSLAPVVPCSKIKFPAWLGLVLLALTGSSTTSHEASPIVRPVPEIVDSASRLTSAKNLQGMSPEQAPLRGQSSTTPVSGQEPTKSMQLTYEDGQLTIAAENVPLSEVLAAVRAKVSADIEVPAGAADQRIWIHLGPGPVRSGRSG